jgi:hypothetical protein
MSSNHLSCAACRIRIRASAPEVHLLDGMCPACGAALQAATHAADVLGFRAFDWSMVIGENWSEQPHVVLPPVDLRTRREHVAALNDLDMERSLNTDGRSVDEEVGRTATGLIAP